MHVYAAAYSNTLRTANAVPAAKISTDKATFAFDMLPLHQSVLHVHEAPLAAPLTAPELQELVPVDWQPLLVTDRPARKSHWRQKWKTGCNFRHTSHFAHSLVAEIALTFALSAILVAARALVAPDGFT